MAVKTHAFVAGIAACVLAVALGGCGASGSSADRVAGDAETAAFTLTSSAFEPDGAIPVEHARQGVDGGEDVSIPYAWSGAPEGTESFALLLMDTSPVARKWLHWVVVDIPAQTTELPAGASGADMPPGAMELTNSFSEPGYGGPEPPAGTGGHQYLARVYALDVEHLEIAEDADLRAFLRALEDHVLADASVAGTFGR